MPIVTDAELIEAEDKIAQALNEGRITPQEARTLQDWAKNSYRTHRVAKAVMGSGKTLPAVSRQARRGVSAIASIAAASTSRMRILGAPSTAPSQLSGSHRRARSEARPLVGSCDVADRCNWANAWNRHQVASSRTCSRDRPVHSGELLRAFFEHAQITEGSRPPLQRPPADRFCPRKGRS